MKGADYPKLEEGLLTWIETARNNHPPMPVSGPIIKEKAMQMSEAMKISGVQASNGWLNNFIARTGLLFKKGMWKSQLCRWQHG